METKRENTVHTSAISAQDLVSKFQPMTREQFESEKNYHISVSIICFYNSYFETKRIYNS